MRTARPLHVIWTWSSVENTFPVFLRLIRLRACHYSIRASIAVYSVICTVKTAAAADWHFLINEMIIQCKTIFRPLRNSKFKPVLDVYRCIRQHLVTSFMNILFIVFIFCEFEVSQCFERVNPSDSHPIQMAPYNYFSLAPIYRSNEIQ